MRAKQITPGGDRRSVTVTFHYPDEWRVVVANSRAVAFAEARERWGDGWEGEPTVSTPGSIYRDLTGQTALAHGQDHGTRLDWAQRRDRFRRNGQPYAETSPEWQP